MKAQKTRRASLSAEPAEQLLLERPDVAMLARPVAILAEGATEPPAELCLFAAGVIETTKGLFKVDPDACASVSRCYADLGRKLHMDWEHGSVGAMYAVDPRAAGKAAAHFDVEVREGAIWAARIQWTPAGREDVLSKAFLYTSPTFRHDEEGRVLELLSCALTNDPAIKRREPLMAARSAEPTDKEQKMKTLLARLGLADGASEAEALVSLTKLQEQLSRFLGVSGKTDTSEAIGVLSGWKAAADQVTVLTAKLAEIEKTTAQAEIDKLIDEAKKDGRLPPAAEKAARDVAASGVGALRSMLSVLPKTGKPAGEKATGEVVGVEGLTATEIEGCRKTGTDPKKFAEHKAASLARRNAA